HGQRGAFVQGEADPAQDLIVIEGLPDLRELDHRLRWHGARHQNRNSSSLVRKKSEMITPMATCTTVAVVDRPRPSVPPSVARPLWQPISVTIAPNIALFATPVRKSLMTTQYEIVFQ